MPTLPIVVVQREWYNGSIVAFQAIDPGSTPGSRTFSGFVTMILFLNKLISNSLSDF